MIDRFTDGANQELRSPTRHRTFIEYSSERVFRVGLMPPDDAWRVAGAQAEPARGACDLAGRGLA